MQIGDLAAKAGVTPRTIRYYEEMGLVEPEERTGGGFRIYSEAQLRRLRIVQSLKDLGFELDRIREFFNLKKPTFTALYPLFSLFMMSKTRPFSTLITVTGIDCPLFINSRVIPILVPINPKLILYLYFYIYS